MEDMEFMTIEEKIRYDLNTANTRVDTAKSDLNTATIGTYVTGLVSTEVGNGVNLVFTFAGLTPLGGSLVPDTEQVESLGLVKIRTTEYTLAGNVVTFTAGNAPAGGNVYLSGILPKTWAF